MSRLPRVLVFQESLAEEKTADVECQQHNHPAQPAVDLLLSAEIQRIYKLNHQTQCERVLMSITNVNVNLYSTSSQNNASNALNVPSTVQKETSSVYDENSQFACPAHANCFRTSSVSLVQRQQRCDGRTYRAETVERVDGGWRNEDAVIQQLERVVYTAQTDNPVPGHASTCTPLPQACICHIEPM